MTDETYKLYKIASVSNDKQCNIVKPFDWAKFELEYNPITKKPIIDEDVDAVKAAFLRVNNAEGGDIIQCCDPNATATDSNLMASYKRKFPFVREVVQNGEVKYIDVSTGPQDIKKGWKVLTPYLLCRISKTAFKPTKDPKVFRSVELVPGCYTRDCKGANTITLEHLFNSARTDMTFSYYDDAKVADAVRTGSVDGVAQYLRKYNNADLPLTHDDAENRVLHLACRYYHPKVFDLIVAVKPNLNIKNGSGDTPLHVACRYGNLDVIERLVKLGAEMNIKNDEGMTPVMVSVDYNHKGLNRKMVHFLYNNGASLLDVDKDGNTILHHIIKDAPNREEKSDLLRFVLERGANPEQANKSGVTPLEMIGSMLEKYDPKPTYTGPVKKQESPYFTEPKVHYKSDIPPPVMELEIVNDTSNKKETKPNPLVVDYLNYLLPTEAQVSRTTQPTVTQSPPARAMNNLNLSSAERLQKWMNSLPKVTESVIATSPSTTSAAGSTTTTSMGTAVGTTTSAATVGSSTTIEPFQVEEQKNLTPKQRELMEIQTMLFNTIIKSNPAKYSGYINVSEIPKGAPVEVLNYMCTGNSSKIQGLENKAECESLGGSYVKIKNPTTLVKLELVPTAEESELYYDKTPDPIPVKPVPKAIQEVNKQIRTNEMFTDFSGSYQSREQIEPDHTPIMDPMQIYPVNREYKNDGNNRFKPNNHPGALDQVAKVSSEAAHYNSFIMANGVDKQQNTLKIKVLTENWQLVVSFVLLIIILIFAVKRWCKPGFL